MKHHSDFTIKNNLYLNGDAIIDSKSMITNPELNAAKLILDSSAPIGEVRVISNMIYDESYGFYGIAYPGIVPITETGVGTGLIVDGLYETTYGSLLVRIIDPGEGYAINDEIRILGTSFGFTTPDDDVIMQIRDVKVPQELSFDGGQLILKVSGDEANVGLGTQSSIKLNNNWFWDTNIVIQSKEDDYTVDPGGGPVPVQGRSSMLTSHPYGASIKAEKTRNPVDSFAGHASSYLTVGGAGYLQLAGQQYSYNQFTEVWDEYLFRGSIQLNQNQILLDARTEDYTGAGENKISGIDLYDTGIRFQSHTKRIIALTTSYLQNNNDNQTIGATSIKNTLDYSGGGGGNWTAEVTIHGNGGIGPTPYAYATKKIVTYQRVGGTLVQIGSVTTVFEHNNFPSSPSVSFNMNDPNPEQLSVEMIGAVDATIYWSWEFKEYVG